MIQNLSYGDDADGNVQTITGNLNGARSQGFTGVYPPAALSADRGNDLNRLETASGLYGAQSYGTYNGVGNRQNVTLAGVGYTYTISPTSNQIVKITTTGGSRNFFYQPQGQLTTDQRAPTSEYEYGYNYSGRLASASRNHSLLASYTYNGFEERAIKAAATTTDFICDRAGHLLAEANAATGAMIREYIWMDDTPVAMVDDTGTNPVVYDIHTDHLGRPQKLTTQSASLAWDGVFDPFGNVTSVSGSATMLLMFPGQYYDSETQLSQNWNRDYDPTIGRYVESDPIGLLGGVHTYAYARNNPAIYIDAFGLCWIYHQSTGQIDHVDEESGNVTDAGQGYAGIGAGYNNPAMQGQEGIGPLPRGGYTVAPQQLNITQAGVSLSASMRLVPDPDTDLLGRTGGFLIHGPHLHDHRNSSEGCIILKRSIRDLIGNSGDNCLLVVQ